MVKRMLAAMAALMIAPAAQAQAKDARTWIADAKGQPGIWEDAGALDLPSRSIIIGDPSWGDDFLRHSALAVPAARMQVWLLVDRPDQLVHAIWLEAAGTVPTVTAERTVVGVDSGFIVVGDRHAGEALSRIDDNYEFLLAQLETSGFLATRIQIPPDGTPIHAISTGGDGGFPASRLSGAGGEFSGILIDITGRSSDGRFVDTLIGQAP